MQLQSFRVKNFRSIRNTNWQNLSVDRVTGLIGQNEAGKTTILEALYSFVTGKISADFLRSDNSWPEVACSFSMGADELKKMFEGHNLPKGLIELVEKNKRINIARVWSDENSSELLLEEEDCLALFHQPAPEPKKIENQKTNEEQTESTEQKRDAKEGEMKEMVTLGEPVKVIAQDQFIKTLFEQTPELEVFADFASLLPDTIDLEELQNKKTKAEGVKGAENLLAIAGLNLEFFQKKELRIVENQIEQLNKKITAGFQEFWTQKIGKTNKIAFEFELKHHDKDQGEKAGRPYLVFWIKDGEEKLYPKQRSKGVRWFTSFYLHLKAGSLRDSSRDRILLIDEPGGSLHARAQEDVLKVFEDIKTKVQVIYTTHSPHLVKLETIYRLLAIQRADEEDDKSETLVFDAHKLGAASTDTLSPIYTLMGADFSHQQVIKKKGNLLLEEISAFYYLTAFWKLVDSQKTVYFLPATGVNNIPQLANLFLGWGLDFAVVIDDDNSGRAVYKELKRNLFQDDEEKAKQKMMKIDGYVGIEDLFTKTDFKKHILENEGESFSESNVEYVRGKPKAVLAMKFMLKVKNGELQIGALNQQTQERIKKLVSDIETLLS